MITMMTDAIIENGERVYLLNGHNPDGGRIMSESEYRAMLAGYQGDSRYDVTLMSDDDSSHYYAIRPVWAYGQA